MSNSPKATERLASSIVAAILRDFTDRSGLRQAWEEVTLTGPMAVWAYLICFHAVVHSFNRVYYDDGRSGAVLIAAHG